MIKYRLNYIRLTILLNIGKLLSQFRNMFNKKMFRKVRNPQLTGNQID